MLSPPIFSIAEDVLVSREQLLQEFDAVQQVLIMESWISLDYANQHAAKEEVIGEAVTGLTADGVLKDILCTEHAPAQAFLCHARREIAHHLIHRFGVRGV